MTEHASPGASREPIDVVAFGMLGHWYNSLIDAPPVPNTVGAIRTTTEHIGDDSTIIAQYVRSWGLTSAIIGTSLGDDDRGQLVRERVREYGIEADLRVAKGVPTSFEFSFSDPTGGRTYWWERNPAILRTLETADLSPVDRARILCVDWYDGDAIVRAMKAAGARGVPVFLNLEHKSDDPDLVRTLAPLTTICQATTDEAQRGTDAEAVARRLLDAGIGTVLVTMASRGSLLARDGERIRLPALRVPLTDACAAGASFSSGFVYGSLTGMDLEASGQFATAAAALACTAPGPKAFPVDEIAAMAAKVVPLT